jgi:formiminoglutamase
MNLFSTKTVANLKESWQFEPHVIAQNTWEVKELTEETPIKIMLIGLDDDEAYKVRYKLYGYSRIPGIDLGDVGDYLGGNTDELEKVLNWCHYHKVLPILISKTYRTELSERIFASKFVPEPAVLGYVGREVKTTYISEKQRSTVNIAYQTHRSLPEHFLQEKGIDLLRLGELRRNIHEAEPYIRTCDLFYFNINSVRYSDAPGQLNPSTSGLFSEECCQLMRYIGLNEQNKLVWIHGYDSKRDSHNATADLIAQMIWYLSRGIYSRKDDYPLDKSRLKVYMVEYNGLEIPLTFYKSSLTNRWWVEVRDSEDGLVPCSYRDYEQAKNDELSDRLIKMLNIYS